MAIHTFSTKEKNKEAVAAIDRIKVHCEQNHLSFSGIVVQLLVEWERANVKRPQ
ncbi:head completion protein [Caudoviricetes sp.]|nr:head completion protein [Caudoviricetes sp.]